MWITGIALIIAGAIFLIFSAYAFHASKSSQMPLLFRGAHSQGARTVGIILLVMGILVVIGGVVMLILGL